MKKNLKLALINYTFLLVIGATITILFNACNSTKKIKNQTTKTKVKQAQKSDVTNITTVEEITNDYQNKNGEIPFQFIENPPVYPGCEGLKGQKAKSCLQKHIFRFVGKNFDTSIASELGLTGQKVQILCQFTIDKDGKISRITARSQFKELNDEAKRVIGLLPQMQPGKIKDRLVKVTYTLPIIFKIDEEEEKK